MYSPPGLHRPCHSLHIPTNVWGAQDHDTGDDTCMLHSNTHKTFYLPLPTMIMPEYSMSCQRKSEGKKQKQNKRIAHNSTPHLGRVRWKRGDIIFSPVHILLHVLPSPSCSPPPQLCPQCPPFVPFSYACSPGYGIPPPRSSRILYCPWCCFRCLVWSHVVGWPPLLPCARRS